MLGNAAMRSVRIDSSLFGLVRGRPPMLWELAPTHAGKGRMEFTLGNVYPKALLWAVLAVDFPSRGRTVEMSALDQGDRCQSRDRYQLNVRETMRYDRIYLGACANPRSKYLYRPSFVHLLFCPLSSPGSYLFACQPCPQEDPKQSLLSSTTSCG